MPFLVCDPVASPVSGCLIANRGRLEAFRAESPKNPRRLLEVYDRLQQKAMAMFAFVELA
jgi:hypothetical protein